MSRNDFVTTDRIPGDNMPRVAAGADGAPAHSAPVASGVMAGAASHTLDAGNAGRSPRLRSFGVLQRLTRKQRDAVYRWSLGLADILAAAIALVISIVVVGVGHAGIATLATVPVIVLISKFIGTYDLEDLLVRKSTLDETATLFQVATLYALTAWLIDGLVVTGERGRRELIVLWAALFALLLVFRAIARAICRAVTRPERCVLIADEETCNRIRSKFGRSRTAHSEVVGCILPHDRASEHAVTSATHDVVELRKILEPLRADRVIIAPAEAEEHELVNLVHAATLLRLKVSVVPRVLEVVGPSVHVDDVEGLPLLSTRPFGLSRSSRVIKRGLDLVGSGVMLIVLSPMMTMAAIAIKLDSHGPVFFRQHRVGRDGAPFEMLKFRTMSPDAEARKQALVEQNEADGMFKIANDPRITRVGRVLRRTSLDELPQLLHVFRGQMSLVGPRPLVQEEDIRIVGWRRRRLQLVPGMTGYWQVLGSSRIPLDEMVRIDYLYVSNWSLWLDLKILLRTVGHVFTARGM